MRAARELRRVSRRKLVEQLDVAMLTLGRYETGERQPSADFVIRVAEALDVDAAWLLTGSGTAPAGIEEMPPVPHDSSDLPEVAAPDEVAWIDKFAAEPTAGEGGALDDRRVGRFPLAADVARELGHPRVKLGAVRVRGDSMSPTLSDGDYVIVARDPTAVEDICVLEVGGELLVKRVHRDMTTGGLIVVSDNKAYPPQPIGPDAHVRIIGRVVKEDRVRRR